MRYNDSGSAWSSFLGQKGRQNMEQDDIYARFTERARHVLSLAQEEAQQFQHKYIGTEHLLLGLVRESDGIAARVLMNLGVELNKVRSAVQFIIGRGDEPVTGPLKLTPRSKKVIEMAADEADRMNHHYIGTEHLLLGLARESEGIAAGVLNSLGVTLEKLRASTIQLLSSARGMRTTQASKQPRKQPVRRETLSSASERSEAPGSPTRDRFNKFTERARKVLSLAQEESQRFQVNYIGTEHLLLGLVREDSSVAARVLANLGVKLEDVGKAVEFIIGRGDRIVSGEGGLTPRAKKVIELAVDEARRLNHHYIGTEHLLLGLVREGEGIAAGVLASLGVKLEDVRKETLKVLGQQNGGPPTA
jgi:ATP-dependent Clp protease ATP-binding subunit ClpA